MIIDDVPLEDW